MTRDAGPWAAVAFGFALGAAPGPVQLLLLSQATARGLAGGLRVMLGANLTLLSILVALALGLSAADPSPAALRLLRVLGGGVLVALAAIELRAIVRRSARAATPPGGRWGPTAIGVLAVALNPGAWLFFATTASSILATTAARDGRTAAVATAFAIAVGVSGSDLLFSVLGSGGHRWIGERGLRWIRGGLATALLAVGLAFLVQGLRA